jgi:hypothetical protein
VRLHALVVILGFSRMVAVRFPADTTGPATLRLLLERLDDTGGAGEVLTESGPG